jgi:hypothetical protein
MRARTLLLAALLLVSFAALLGCGGTTDPTGNCGTGWDRFVAALEGNPSPECPSTVPDVDPESTGPASPCPTPAGNACGICIAQACCAEVSACTDEDGCGCLLTCRAGGGSVASCATSCDAAPDARYTAAASCTSAHCAAQCPGLQ